jgi:hypothetical protein
LIALEFWIDPPPDPLDPNFLEVERSCRIYDVDCIRYATVDAKYYAQLIAVPNRPPAARGRSRSQYGRLRPRLWYIKPIHPSRHDKKEYFVTNNGWRDGRQTFLHVEVMRLSGRKPPSPRHKLVNHIDGDEWNCTEDNLEWATHVKNRRASKQRYNRPEEP